MKLALTNYLSTAEETEAASEVCIRCIYRLFDEAEVHEDKCIYTVQFQMYESFYKINVLYIFLNTNTCWKMQYF